MTVFSGKESPVMQPNSVEFLARFLANLRDGFGAEVVDARDDLGGGIVVDVRLDAGMAIRARRSLVRQRVHVAVGRSRDLVDESRSLSERANVLVAEMRMTDASRRQQLNASRQRLREVRRLRLDRAGLGSGQPASADEA